MLKERLRRFGRIAPVVLFLLACFPSRGLYFLLHPPDADGRFHSSQPVFNSPVDPRPKLKPARVPLPARLTRVPRTQKPSPDLPRTAPSASTAPAPRVRRVPLLARAAKRPPAAAAPGVHGRAPPAAI